MSNTERLKVMANTIEDNREDPSSLLEDSDVEVEYCVKH